MSVGMSRFSSNAHEIENHWRNLHDIFQIAVTQVETVSEATVLVAKHPSSGGQNEARKASTEPSFGAMGDDNSIFDGYFGCGHGENSVQDRASASNSVFTAGISLSLIPQRKTTTTMMEEKCVDAEELGKQDGGTVIPGVVFLCLEGLKITIPESTCHSLFSWQMPQLENLLVSRMTLDSPAPIVSLDGVFHLFFKVHGKKFVQLELSSTSQGEDGFLLKELCPNLRSFVKDGKPYSSTYHLLNYYI
ncbi:hypothetical protein E1B28_002033 [Marasmius oreades]|uniref:Uncharacterized protein n=1 Tax=Marasmius oreades TaxID=181124 RepID=A0A9P8AGJ8_9AGAR|nr:uncharacterized protein E1B28_002033 [Marasmius oreades]KAG7100260.1 hypothetical protein E1B28_002033 [Marasmius oreades]